VNVTIPEWGRPLNDNEFDANLVEEMWFIEGANDFVYHPNLFFRAVKELHIGFKPRT
jgi:hypothetical protein